MRIYGAWVGLHTTDGIVVYHSSFGESKGPGVVLLWLYPRRVFVEYSRLLAREQIVSLNKYPRLAGLNGLAGAVYDISRPPARTPPITGSSFTPSTSSKGFGFASDAMYEEGPPW